MRKNYLILIVLITMCLLSSCEKNNDVLIGYRTKETPIGTADIVLKTDRWRDNEVVDDRDFLFDDQIIRLDYDNTVHGYRYKDVRWQYSSADINQLAGAWVNPLTNQIIGMSYSYKRDALAKEDKRSDEFYIQKAKDFLSNYVSNVELYQFCIVDSTEYSCRLFCSKEIDNIEIPLGLNITFFNDGTLYAYLFDNLFFFFDESKISIENIEDIKAEIEEKIVSVKNKLNKNKEYENIEFSIKKKRWIITQEGKYAIEYMVLFFDENEQNGIDAYSFLYQID